MTSTLYFDLITLAAWPYFSVSLGKNLKYAMDTQKFAQLWRQ